MKTALLNNWKSRIRSTRSPYDKSKNHIFFNFGPKEAHFQEINCYELFKSGLLTVQKWIGKKF